MRRNPTGEFKLEAIGAALTSGLPRKPLAAELGIELSTLEKTTLEKWIKRARCSTPVCFSA